MRRYRRRGAGARLLLACGHSTRRKPSRQEPGPDLDFLEYLGAWAEEDDEWLAIEEWQKDNGADARTRIPKGPRE